MTGPRALVAALACAASVLATAGCTGDAPRAAGAAATGYPAEEPLVDSVEVFFVTSGGLWPVRRAVEGEDPMSAALDALVAGPDPAELGRGLSSELPSGSGAIAFSVSEGRVDIDLPFAVSTLDPGSRATEQLVCTAAASPSVPGGLDPTDVVVGLHEFGDPETTGPVRCGADGELEVIR